LVLAGLSVLLVLAQIVCLVVLLLLVEVMVEAYRQLETQVGLEVGVIMVYHRVEVELLGKVMTVEMV
jgi:hypothetical protein